MRILFLSAANSVHTVKWVNALAERGNIVYLVYLKGHGNKDNSLDKRVKTIELPVGGSAGYYLNAFCLGKIAKRIRPDVVNAHYASGYGTLMRMARLRKTVLSVWGSDVYDFPYQNTASMKIIRRNLLYADKIASTSHCMAEQVRRILNRNIDITVTPFGVDLSVFDGKKNSGHGEEIVIGCIKTLEAKYGMKYLIMGIRLLLDGLCRKGHPDLARKIKCNIYGEGTERNSLECLIKEQGLQGIVTLKGRIPHNEVPDALRNMDIFCVTSILDSESFGVSAVEAQAMGIPVVASNVDGFCEVVENGTTGLIVEKESAQQTADAMERLVLDKKMRETMGNSARKRVERLYDWDNNVSLLEKCYKEVKVIE